MFQTHKGEEKVNKNHFCFMSFFMFLFVVTYGFLTSCVEFFYLLFVSFLRVGKESTSICFSCQHKASYAGMTFPVRLDLLFVSGK